MATQEATPGITVVPGSDGKITVCFEGRCVTFACGSGVPPVEEDHEVWQPGPLEPLHVALRNQLERVLAEDVPGMPVVLHVKATDTLDLDQIFPAADQAWEHGRQLTIRMVD